MPKKVAIAIGIKDTPNLDSLPGAVADAKNFAAWATSQGFDVHEFVDSSNPVAFDDISRAVEDAANSGRVEALFIFFSGHGQCWGRDQDYWLLSGGSQATGEVVDVDAMVKDARNCGIPHIAIFADACRTIGKPIDLGIQHRAGSPFPGGGRGVTQVRLDQFYATGATQAALEITFQSDPNGRKVLVDAHGLFTKHLLNGLCGRAPAAQERDAIRGGFIVSGSALEAHVCKEVKLESSRVSPSFVQCPDCRIESRVAYARVQPPVSVPLTVQAVLPSGAFAVGATVNLYRFDFFGHTQWTLIASSKTSLQRQASTGFVYGVEAALAQHVQEPPKYDPITHLASPTTKDVLLVPSPVGPLGPSPGGLGPGPPGLGPTYGLGPPNQISPSVSQILTRDGSSLAAAPKDSVYLVKTKDRLTGAASLEYQWLTGGESPRSIDSPDSGLGDRWLDYFTIADRPQWSHQDPGLVVYGEGLEGWAARERFVELDAENEALPCQIIAGRTPEIVVLQIAGALYCPTPILPGYIGQIRIGPRGTEAMSYLPLDLLQETSSRDVGKHVEELMIAQAWAQAAALHGQWSVLLDKELPVARALQGGQVHPLLCALSAYTERSREVLDSWAKDLESESGAFPADIALAMRRPLSDKSLPTISPMPLATAGWLLLRDEEELLRYYAGSLMATLWTTIQGKAGADLANAVQRGEM